MILQSLLVLQVPLVSHLADRMGLCWELPMSSWFLHFQRRVGAALGAHSRAPGAMEQESGLSFPLSKGQPPCWKQGWWHNWFNAVCVKMTFFFLGFAFTEHQLH